MGAGPALFGHLPRGAVAAASCGQQAPTRCRLTSFSGAGLLRCCRWKSLRRCWYTITVMPLKGGWKEGAWQKASCGRGKRGSMQMSTAQAMYTGHTQSLRVLSGPVETPTQALALPSQLPG